MIEDLITDKMKYIEKVTRDLGDIISFNDYYIEDLGCPHKQPSSLPKGYAAIYIFAYGTETEFEFLKIGKANGKSAARFTSQHYGFSAPSTLAKSICKDEEFISKGIDVTNVKAWMLENLHRINIYVKADCGKAATELIESVLHYALRPRYEGNI